MVRLRQQIGEKRLSERQLARLTAELLTFLQAISNDLVFEQQQALIGRFFNECRLQGLAHCFDPLHLLDSHLVDSVASLLQKLLVEQHKQAYQARRFVAALATGINYSQLGAAGRRLGLGRKAMKSGMCRRLELESGSGSLFKVSTAGRRRLTESDRKLIVEFWHNNTRPSPRTADVVRSKHGAHARHFLETSQAELYMNFSSKYPDVFCGQRTFQKLKPFYVKRLKRFNTCCCIEHVSMLQLREALMRMRSVVHEQPCPCTCSVCLAGCSRPLPRMSLLVQTVLCVPADEFSEINSNCELGKCVNCGSDKYEVCPLEQVSTAAVTWKSFKYQSWTDNNGIKRRKLRLVYSQGRPLELISEFKNKLDDYIPHAFIYKWQHLQYRKAVEDVPVDTVVSVMDFGENFTLLIQDEPQSMHWSNTQVTLFVIISYVSGNLVPTSEAVVNGANETVKEVHCFVSDDLQHDAEFAMHCLQMHYQWLLRRFTAPKYHQLWSDGPTSQFRNNKFQFFLGRYYNASGIQLQHNFTAPGHGKGEHDAFFGFLRSQLRVELMKCDGSPIRNAQQVVDFCNANLATQRPVAFASQVKPITRLFWLVDNVDRETEYRCRTLKSMKQFFSWRGARACNATAVEAKKLSCNCSACYHGSGTSCSHTQESGTWVPFTCVPIANSSAVDVDVEEEEPVSCVGEAVQVGDYFAICTGPDNFEQDDFWLVLCTEQCKIFANSFKDQWGNVIEAGEQALAGLWCEQVPFRERCFVVLEDTAAVFLSPRVVKVTGITLQATGTPDREGRQILQLSYEDHVNILESISP